MSAHRYPLVAVFVPLTSFSIFYWCIFVQLVDALRDRVAEERDKMTAEMERIIDDRKKAMLENIRQASGRRELSPDPISVVAATIEATRSPKSDQIDPAVNPLRGALDGTLRPEHLTNPEDDINEQGF